MPRTGDVLIELSGPPVRSRLATPFAGIGLYHGLAVVFAFGLLVDWALSDKLRIWLKFVQGRSALLV